MHALNKVGRSEEQAAEAFFDLFVADVQTFVENKSLQVMAKLLFAFI